VFIVVFCAGAMAVVLDDLLINHPSFLGSVVVLVRMLFNSSTELIF
jgi:hypothetical protein